MEPWIHFLWRLGFTPSQVETLFAYQKREDSEDTQTFGMSDKKNLIIITPSNAGENTLVEDSAETQDLALGAGAVDGILNENRVIGAANNKFVYFDFGSVDSREIFWSGGIKNAGTDTTTYAIDLETATTKPTWTVKDTMPNSGTAPFGSQLSFPYPQNRVIAAHSFRYLRIRTYRISGGPSDFASIALAQICVTDLYDVASSPSSVTPNSVLTFEVKDDLTGDWIESIPATVALNGVSNVFGGGSKAEVGFEGNPTATKYILIPDLSTNYRAKLVTNRGMKNGVFVIKV